MTNRNKDDIGRMLAFLIVWAVVLTIIFCSLAGCRTVYQPYPVPEYHEIHDTIIEKSRYDSIIYKDKFVKDSASFKQKGDTVWIERWHWERDYSYEKILQNRIDSILSAKQDSIPYPVPGPTKYINELKKWQKALIWWGVICTAIFVLIVVIKIKHPKL